MGIGIITFTIDVHPNHSDAGEVHKEVIVLKGFAIQGELVIAHRKISNLEVSKQPPVQAF